MARKSQSRVNLASHGPGMSLRGVTYAWYSVRNTVAMNAKARHR